MCVCVWHVYARRSVALARPGQCEGSGEAVVIAVHGESARRSGRPGAESHCAAAIQVTEYPERRCPVVVAMPARV